MNGRHCTRCGTALEAGAGFCRACGMPAGVDLPEVKRVAPVGRGGGTGAKRPVFAVGCMVVFVGLAWVFLSQLNAVWQYRATRQGDLGNRIVRSLAGKDAARASDEYFALLKGRDYDEAYKMLDGEAQGALDFQTFTDLMKGIEEKLGARRKHSLMNAQVRKVIAGKASSEFFVLRFSSDFEKGPAVEEVTLKKIDGIMYVHYYDIKSELIPPEDHIRPRRPDDGGGDWRREPERRGPDQPREKPTLTI